MADDDNFDIDIYGDDSYQDTNTQDTAVPDATISAESAENTTTSNANPEQSNAGLSKRLPASRQVMTHSKTILCSRYRALEALAMMFTDKHRSNRAQSGNRARVTIVLLTRVRQRP